MDKHKKDKEIEGQLNSIPNEKYAKFFSLFSDIDTLEVEKWNIAHLLGYFCKKYKSTYNEDYHWKFNNENPKKCFEVWQMNTLVARISKNPKILKEYIDWAYENLVPKAKRRFTSISFITKEDVVINYKTKFLFADKKDLHVSRSTALPTEYRSIFTLIGVNIPTYGDLAFIDQMTDKSAELQTAFDKIVEIGFDLDVLKRVI